jgi:hypothetical protein
MLAPTGGTATCLRRRTVVLAGAGRVSASYGGSASEPLVSSRCLVQSGPRSERGARSGSRHVPGRRHLARSSRRIDDGCGTQRGSGTRSSSAGPAQAAGTCGPPYPMCRSWSADASRRLALAGIADGARSLASTAVEVFRVHDGRHIACRQPDRLAASSQASTDALGRSELSLAVQVRWAWRREDMEYWCGHSRRRQAGASLKRDGSGPARGAASEVLERASARVHFDIDLDLGRFRAESIVAKRRTNFDFAVNDSIDTWELHRPSPACPCFPCEVRTSSEGLWSAGGAAPRGPNRRLIAHLERRRDSRSSARQRPAVSLSRRSTRFTLDFAKHREGFAQTRTLTGDPDRKHGYCTQGKACRQSHHRGLSLPRVGVEVRGAALCEPMQTAMRVAPCYSPAHQVLYDYADQATRCPCWGHSIKGPPELWRQVDVGMTSCSSPTPSSNGRSSSASSTTWRST